MPWEDITNLPDLNGSEILLEAHKLVNGPRQDAYSHPLDDYNKVAALFKQMTGIDLTAQQAVTFMICVKLARIATNARRGRWHHDSVVDTAGYLACLSMIHTRQQDLKKEWDEQHGNA